MDGAVFMVQKILCGYICKSLVPESIQYFPFIKESQKAEKKNKSGTTESYEVPKGYYGRHMFPIASD
ncbi:hypothetical protein C805_00107 [Eubacterium sp. 14-2]|nr:hypothetical protein C805_00107 [Eubacterium sp. 14-2]